MNKKIIITILVAAIIAVAVILFFVTNRSQAPNKDSESKVQSSVQRAAESPPKTSQVSSTGKYIDYSADALSADEGAKILFFHAPWCPQCRTLDTDIANNIASDAGVTIYKVDYDSNQALRRKYGVTLQTTLVRVDENGNLVKKYVAYDNPTYAQVKANLF
jgi:thiol-disulfide isomerase/thioredoxin